MIPIERRRAILRLLRTQGTATIAELVDLLGVSHMTVRRDILVLEKQGRVVPVSGGVALPERLLLDASHTVKTGLAQEAKRAIARVAATMVTPGDLVFLDAGTTGLALAQELAQRTDLVLLTNDLTTASFLSAHCACTLYTTGGKVDLANMSMEGDLTAQTIGSFNIDIAFLSTPAFDLRGISVPSGAKRVVKEAIVANAAKTVLVTDATKYGRVAALRSVRLTDLDGIITDSSLPESAQSSLIERGLSLHLVDPSNDKPQTTMESLP